MPLRIIGAGLGRTGTVSLKIALERLGFRRCYHMMEFLVHPEHGELWQRALDGRPDWDALFAGYAATVDYPACAYWRELAAFYPDAKVILTIRDPEAWIASAMATIFSPGRMDVPPDPRLAPAFAAVHKLHRDLTDRAGLIAEFERHNRDVIAAIAPERLLVFDVAEGWDKLCRFLNVPVPAMPFPRANTREEMAAMLARVQGDGGGMDPDRIRRAIEERLARLGGGAPEP